MHKQEGRLILTDKEGKLMERKIIMSLLDDFHSNNLLNDKDYEIIRNINDMVSVRLIDYVFAL